MSRRKIFIAVAVFLSIPVVFIIAVGFLMTEGSIPTDDEIISVSDKLVDDSMAILKKYPDEAFSIPEKEWPESIRSLSPLSVSANSEGLYITTKERFVDVWGVFMPREDSEKYLENKSMPVYDRVVKGIYRFYAG